MARGDHAQMIGELHLRARGLVEHYRRYGVFNTETSRPELLAKAGREVVWALDYVSLAGDLEYCIEYCESHVAADACSEMAELRADRDEIASIVASEIPPEEILKILAELAPSLRDDCASTGGADLFYYELACGSRTQIEMCIELLRKSNMNSLISLELEKSIRASEACMRTAMAEIAAEYPSLERPFPRCPEYTPKSYWWYLR